MLDTILKEHGEELLGALTGSGLDASQAEGLLPPALSGITDALGSGDLDLGSLLSGGEGGIEGLLGKLDIGSIASQANLDEGAAQNGLAGLIPVALSLLGDKAGGADGLLSMLGDLTGDSSGGGGALGTLGKLAGSFLGKK